MYYNESEISQSSGLLVKITLVTFQQSSFLWEQLEPTAKSAWIKLSPFKDWILLVSNNFKDAVTLVKFWRSSLLLVNVTDLNLL